MKKPELVIDGNSLSLELIDFFISSHPEVKISPEALKAVNSARSLIDKWVENEEVIYGVTTGFGEFSNVIIPRDEIEELQENLILSHSAGVGEEIPPVIVKVMMLLRANALARGHSGIKEKTLLHLVEMINRDIIPVIPSQGSVGSSGDLAPLAHLVLAMIGKGKVRQVTDWENAACMKQETSAKVFKKYNMSPVTLGAKEGLALINGTQMMTAFASRICIRAKKLVKLAEIGAAMTHEALRATDKAYDERLHKLRPHKGQLTTARNMLKLIKGSEIRKSHLTNDKRVQDSYSIRCIPQIHGASRDTVDYVCSVIETEMNSVTDNPLIFPEQENHIEGGNFHGQPVALVMDFMKLALAELASVSERRIERLVNGSLSGLPRFLTPKGGLNSGLMIAQYTAASLVSENKTLAHPASVDSIPTSANQEDHNSMGSIASRHCYEILKNVETVIAIEMLVAAQGIEFLKPLKCGKGTMAAYGRIREKVKPLEHDRILYEDIQSVLNLLRDGDILTAVEKEVKLL